MTDEEESYRRLRDPVHVTLITCCVFIMTFSDIAKGRFQTNLEKVWSFAKPGAGGVSEGGEKNKLLF